MPEWIQMSRQHPWRAENPDAVIVARPKKWGNPFAIGAEVFVTVESPSGQTRGSTQFIATREQAVALFRAFILLEPRKVLTIQAQLRGYDLACWCPLDQPCHADVLLEIANG